MALAYAVYLGLMCALIAVWTHASRSVRLGHNHLHRANFEAALITVLLFTALIGGRYAVGGDFFGYIYYYDFTSLKDRTSDVVFEPGFLYLIQILKIFDAPNRAIIFASSFIQILFFAIWLRTKPNISPLVIYFFFCTLMILEVNNLIRQGIALFVILVSLDSLHRRKIFQFFLLVLFASFFHRSALVILPLGLLLWHFRMPPIWIQLGILLLAYSLVGLFTNNVISIFVWISPIFGYESYSNIDRLDLAFNNTRDTANLGKYLWPFVDTLIILYSRKINRNYIDSGYRIYHALFLLAAILQPVSLAWNYLPFARSLFYFTAMRMICLAFMTRYCLVDSKKVVDFLIGLGTCAVLLVWLVVAVWRGAAASSPYQF